MEWKNLLDHEGDALLTWLREAEEGCKRAILGIWLFIMRKMPEQLRHLLTWLQGKFFYACRVAVRMARLAALVTAWCVIAFGPVVAYTSVITGAWMVLALAGSAYGVRRKVRKHNGAWSFNKEGSRARA